MLTSVAFKFIISDQLPKISYSTFLDEFMSNSFLYITMLSFYFTIAPYAYEEDGKDHDLIAMYVFLGIFVFFIVRWLYKAWLTCELVKCDLPAPIPTPYVE